MIRPPKTIAEQGGLRVYLTMLGFDFDLFTLLDMADIPNPQIAQVLQTKRQKGIKPDRGTIRRWRKELHSE